MGSGFACPKCERPETGVVETRVIPRGGLRRRRICNCGHKFSTMEIPLVKSPPKKNARYDLDVNELRKLKRSMTYHEIAARKGVSYNLIWRRINSDD